MLVDLDAIPRREPDMEPFEVMISRARSGCSRSSGRTLGRGPRGVRAVGPAGAIIGRVTDDGDIAIVEGGLDADGRPRPDARELARMPAPR
jgi:hypothetical protein